MVLGILELSPLYNSLGNNTYFSLEKMLSKGGRGRIPTYVYWIIVGKSTEMKWKSFVNNKASVKQ